MIRRITLAERYERYLCAHRRFRAARTQADREWWGALMVQWRGEWGKKVRIVADITRTHLVPDVPCITSGKQGEELFGEGSEIAGWCYALTKTPVHSTPVPL